VEENGAVSRARDARTLLTSEQRDQNDQNDDDDDHDDHHEDEDEGEREKIEAHEEEEEEKEEEVGLNDGRAASQDERDAATAALRPAIVRGTERGGGGCPIAANRWHKPGATWRDRHRGV